MFYFCLYLLKHSTVTIKQSVHFMAIKRTINLVDFPAFYKGDHFVTSCFSAHQVPTKNIVSKFLPFRVDPF